MKQNLKQFWQAWKDTFDDFLDYRILRMSAALAYYTVFAMVPMLMIIISITSVFAIGKPEGTIFMQIRSFVGDGPAKLIESMINSAVVSNSTGVAQVVSIIALLFSATGVFTEIQDSINILWRVKAKPKRGWLKLLINRLLSFSIVISLGFILMVSLILNAILEGLSAQLSYLLPQANIVNAYVSNMLLTFITSSCLFIIIFKVLPDVRVKWIDVVIGSIITSISFMIGKLGISIYLQKSPIASTYGAAGSVIVILLWVYYSATILYVGAAFTRANARIRGRNIYPNQNAVWTERIERDLEAESLLRKEKE